jgi:hypothetical protein
MTIRASAMRTVRLGKHDHLVRTCPTRFGDNKEEAAWLRATTSDLPPGLRVGAVQLWIGPLRARHRLLRARDWFAANGYGGRADVLDLELVSKHHAANREPEPKETT